MRNVSGTTPAERKLVTSLQRAVDSIEDNSLGTQSLTDIARKVDADCFPLGIDIYSNPVIIAKDLVPFATNKPLSSFANSISGSFSYNCKPCSVLISNGKVVCGESCHYWTLGKPESVVYRLNTGEFGIKRVETVNELPSKISWAIGGMGLLANYMPDKEGFTGKYADVLRKTNHTIVGYKGNHVYMAYCKNMTGIQVNHYAEKLKLDAAILLDGGHVAAINSESTKINTSEVQYYAIQAR